MAKQKQNVNGITEGVIWQQLLLFFFPILLGTFFQQLYNTADAMIVGRFVGKEALSAVGGTTNTIINLLIGFFIGLSSGATVIISQFFGARQREDVNRAVHTAIALSVAGGAILAVVGIAAAPWALRLLNTPADVLPHALTYLRIYFAGTIGNLIFNIGSGILRAIGDSKRPLYVLIACCGVNIVLDLLLTIPLGVAGAGLATILSQLVSAVLVLILLARSGEDFRVHPKKVRLHRDLLKGIFRIGLPAGLQSVFYSLSNMIIQSSINTFGTDIIAGWTVYGKIDGIFWMMMSAFGISITTFVGQNYGARQYARVKKGVRVCLGMAFGASAILCLIIYVFGGAVTHLFTDDPAVVEQSRYILRFMVPYFLTYVCIEILSGALRGSGDSLRPMLMTCFGVCGTRVAWILLAVPYFKTFASVMVSYPISWTLSSILFILYYKYFSALRNLNVDMPLPGAR